MDKVIQSEIEYFKYLEEVKENLKGKENGK